MTYVLVVEDNQEHLAYVSALLTHHDLMYQSAPHGAAALAKAHEAAPRLVLCDLQMPLMDGYTLLRHWKSDARLKHIPFVVHTSTYVERADEHLAFELGADEFIQKFVDPEELIARLKSILAQPRRQDDVGGASSSPMSASTLEHYNQVLFRKLNAKTEELRAAKKDLAHSAKKQLDGSEPHSSILNSLPMLVAIVDPNGIIFEVNDAWKQHADGTLFPPPNHGVTESFLGILDTFTARNADCGRMAQGIRDVLAGTAATFSMELSWHYDARRRWFEFTVIPLKGVGPGGAVITSTDISDRKYLSARIVESESQYLLMLNSTAEGIYRVNTDGVCTFCNATAARLLGYGDPREILGHAVHEHHHHSRADGTTYPAKDCKVYLAFRTGRATHVDDEVFFRSDGSQFPVEYWSDPIWDEDRVTGAVVTFMDITTRHNLHMQLLQSQKMEAVGRLAGGVAHDFNNALQIILTYGELLDEQLQQNVPCLEYNQQILAAAQRAASLTRQLLAFSRKQVLRPSLLNLTEVTRNMEQMIQRMIGEHINLRLNVSPSVKPVCADHAQLEQLLVNLAINARDAMPFGGDLWISTANIYLDILETQEHKLVTPGVYVKLSMRDTGIGMTPATQARIFEPFFTTKEAGKGTGLGLSTVHGIVEQSGGYITVDSEPGYGSEFCVYFKAVETESNMIALSGPRPAASRASNGFGTILLVEDEDALRSIVGNILRSHGYRVLEARDGVTAIDLARGHGQTIDLLLTDVILPLTSGRQIADELRVSRPETRIIYMSGYTDDVIAQQGLVNTDVMLLEKPFSKALLLDAVRKAINGVPAADEAPPP